jgi:hypothetical protein
VDAQGSSELNGAKNEFMKEFCLVPDGPKTEVLSTLYSKSLAVARADVAVEAFEPPSNSNCATTSADASTTGKENETKAATDKHRTQPPTNDVFILETIPNE